MSSADLDARQPFGVLLRGYRTAVGLTQEDLASRAGLSARAITDLERSVRRYPYPDTVERLGQALELNDAQRAELRAASRRLRGTSALESGRTRAGMNAPLATESEVDRSARVSLPARESTIVVPNKRQSASIQSTFSIRLKSLRLAAGLTQEELAERAGLTSRAVSALETGHRAHPYPHTVRALASALGLSHDKRADLIVAARAPDVNSEPTLQASLRATPAPLTPLIGRERELASIRSLLITRKARLVTITGPGGVGKTRLAQHVAAGLAQEFSDSIAFVSLAPLSDPRLVISAVAETLGLRQGNHPTMLDSLRHYLLNRAYLLVLDNCEHLISALPRLIAALSDCTGVSLLASSRSPIGVRGEFVYPLAPLGVPIVDRESTLQDILVAPATRLFIERAAQAAAFVPTQADVPPIVAICRQVDGLPLALELAAGWVRTAPLPTILEELRSGLQLLSQGGPDLPVRQQTLTATLDWSYELLDAGGQSTLRCLSVCPGGFSLDAAHALLPHEADGRHQLLRNLRLLLDHSLLTTETGSGESHLRYRMLEPIRQYALARLAESGEEVTLLERFADFYVRLSNEAGPAFHGADQGDWCELWQIEHNNLRRAVEWLLDSGRYDQVLQVSHNLWLGWMLGGHGHDGLHWTRRALSLCDPQCKRERARGLWAAGIIAWGVGQRAEADASLAESAALARELGDLHQIAAALIVQAINATSRGDADQADRLLGEALEQVSLWEDDWLYTTALDAQAHLALMRRDFERAFQIITAQERVARRASDWNSLASGLCTHGLCARLLGEDKLAGDLFRESIRVATRTTILNVAMALTGLAGAASRLGESERAARLFGGADSFREKLGQDINWPEWQDLKQQDLELVRTHIGVTKFERMYAEGRAMAPETVVALALS